MLTLSALAGWETAVLASLRGAAGTIEEKDAQIARSGLYAEYPSIFRAYLDLARLRDQPETALEALKRAVFLAWHAVMEPPVYSGLAELPESALRQLMYDLQRAIRAGGIDTELRWMLAWYRGVSSVMFEHYGPVTGLDALVSGLPPDAFKAQALTSHMFEGRGQLGVYWQSVLESAAV